jgi:hypothetical protein
MADIEQANDRRNPTVTMITAIYGMRPSHVTGSVMKCSLLLAFTAGPLAANIYAYSIFV